MTENTVKLNDELDLPADERLSIGYYSSNGLSRSNSSQNINKVQVDDPQSEIMQKRIDDLEIGFKQLDRITDDIDYDIETLEAYTGRVRNGFNEVHEDIQAFRDELMDLFDRLDAVENDMKAKNKKQRFGISNNFYTSTNRRSFFGSRQMLNRASQSDLRGSSYSLDRVEKTYSPATASPATKSPAVKSPARSPTMSPAVPKARSPVHSPEMTPSYSPASSQPLSPARSVEEINENYEEREYSSDVGSDY